MVVIGDDKITDEGSLLKSINSENGKNSLEYYYMFQYSDMNFFSTHYAIGVIPYKHELP